MTRRFLTPLSTNHVDFNLDNPSTWAEGRLWWDDEEGTLELGHGDGVTQSIGMEFFMPPTKNNSGVEIPAGSFVMATGAQGDRITIAKAVTDGSVNPEYMIGVAATTIDNGSETGLITTHGTVRDIDTSDWIVGTILYPSSASPGMFTASAGVAPDIRTPIAIVLRQHENTGRIYVRMTNSHKLGEEQDVKIDNPQNNEVLYYNSSSSLWENTSVSSLIGESGVTSLTGTPNEIEVSASVGSVQVSLPDEVRIESLGMGSASVDVSVDNPIFVAVAGGFSSSQDVFILNSNSIWEQSTLPVSTTWSNITYGNNTFVAVAGYLSGTQIAASSTDGISWTQRTMPSSNAWRIATYGNNVFVAVSSGTAAATSTDGITWTPRTMPSSAVWRALSYNNIFVAVAYGSAAAATSTDGITWTPRTMPSSQNWKPIAYGNDTFLIVATSSTAAATSTDGLTWTASTLPSSGSWQSITYGNQSFIVVGFYSQIAPTSTDGITWTQNTLPANIGWSSIVYGNEKFVAVAYGSNISASSTDGITWTQNTLPATSGLISSTYGISTILTPTPLIPLPTQTGNSGKYLTTDGTDALWETVDVGVTSLTGTPNEIEVSASVGSVQVGLPDEVRIESLGMGSASVDVSSQESIFVSVVNFLASTSTDAITWTQRTVSNDVQLQKLVYGNNIFISSNGNNANLIKYSTNGIIWTSATMPSSQRWTISPYGNNIFVAVAKTDAAATSTDGIIWTARTLPSSQLWAAVSYGNNTFVAVVDGSAAAASSTDGITWTASTMPLGLNWRSLTYGGDTFVAIAWYSSAAATSTDGITWNLGTMPSEQGWSSVTYGNNVFVATSDFSSTAAYSTDGITWTASTMPSSQRWIGLTYGDNIFVVLVPFSSAAATSTDGITWTARTGSSGGAIASAYGTPTTLTPTPLTPLPTQTGNSGKYLTTDGSTSFWDQAAKTYYQSASPSTPLLGDIWIDSDETYTDINPNDYALKSGTDFTGNVTVLSEDSVDTPGVRNIYHSTSEPSGGNNGDVWLVYY